MRNHSLAKMINFLMIFLMSMLFVGCEHTMMTRDTDNVQETVAARGGLKMNIQAAANINTDGRGLAQPVRIKVYQLTDRESFVNANLRDLINQDFLVLGDALIRQTELTISPGQSLNVALDKNISGRYVGVIALFAKPNGESWRAVKPLSANGLQLTIGNNQIFLQ